MVLRADPEMNKSVVSKPGSVWTNIEQVKMCI